MRRITLVRAVAWVVAGAGATGCAEEPVCTFPAAPEGAPAVVHVCPGASGDGSSTSSAKGSLAEAVDAAPAGAVVLLGAGRYEENVTIRRPMTLVGGEVSDEGAGARAELAAPDAYALVVDGATGVTLRGIAVVGARGSGIRLKNGAEARLEGVRVDGTQGFGVLAVGSRLELRRSTVAGSTETGVLLWDGSSGIIDTNNLTANQGGGLRVDDATSPDLATNVAHNAFAGNSMFGVGVFGALAIIDTNNITGTLKGALGGYGVIVATYEGDATADATITGNTLEGSARAGVFLAANTKAIIDTNNISASGTNGLNSAGIWLAAATNATITKNTVAKNYYAGIALVGNATAIIDTNNINGVEHATLTGVTTEVGDGLFLGPGSTSTVKGNAVSSCWRAGVFTDEANQATLLSGNKLTMNGSAMIFQGQSAIGLDGNSASMNAKSDAVDLASASVAANVLGTLGGDLDVPVESSVADAGN